MGKQSDLSDYEKDQLDALHAAGSNYSEIARRLGRSRSTISKYFNQRRSIRGKHASGRKEILDMRTKRRVP